MPPPNPAYQLLHAPFADIIKILLPQFRRLLEQRDIQLTQADIETLSNSITEKTIPADYEVLKEAFRDIVQESIAELQNRFNLNFAESLHASMKQLVDWEKTTTANFLEVANHKNNAELRISAGSSLLVAWGDLQYADYLLTVIEADGNADDVDAVIAKRVLAHVSDISLDQKDWLQAIHNWLESKTET